MNGVRDGAWTRDCAGAPYGSYGPCGGGAWYGFMRSCYAERRQSRHHRSVMANGANSGPGYAKNPTHTVKVTPCGGRVVVRAGGEVLADTRGALGRRGASSPPVYYVPRKDVRMERL